MKCLRTVGRCLHNTITVTEKLSARVQRARLGPKKAVELLKAGANLRLEKKLLEMDMISEMRSWLVEPEDSDDEDEDDNDADDNDGATAQAATPM